MGRHRIRTHSRLKVRGTLSTNHLPLVCRLPSTTSAAQAFQPKPCSAASSVLRSSPTSQGRISSAYAYWLPDALCASRRRSTLGYPDSRVKCFFARMRSQTAQGPHAPRHIGACSVAFGVTPPPQHPGLAGAFAPMVISRLNTQLTSAPVNASPAPLPLPTQSALRNSNRRIEPQ